MPDFGLGSSKSGGGVFGLDAADHPEKEQPADDDAETADHGGPEVEVQAKALPPGKFGQYLGGLKALDDAKLNATRQSLPPRLRAGPGEREDYQYNRTR